MCVIRWQGRIELLGQPEIWIVESHKSNLPIKRLKIKQNNENVAKSNPRQAQTPTINPSHIWGSGVCNMPLTAGVHCVNCSHSPYFTAPCFVTNTIPLLYCLVFSVTICSLILFLVLTAVNKSLIFNIQGYSLSKALNLNDDLIVYKSGMGPLHY